MRLVALAPFWIAAVVAAIGLLEQGSGQNLSPSPAARLAPYKERLAAAQSVKVLTSLLGIELGMPLEQVRANLEPLSDPTSGQLHEDDRDAAESEHKFVWRLATTDFTTVSVKTDDKGRVSYLECFLRPGKEFPFSQIGELEKAPMRTDRAVAWDVVRPQRPLTRVVARGADGKASSILIFAVQRPGPQESRD